MWTRRSGPHAVRLQKLLFSATLDRNPGKIASLGLYDPTYISVSSDSSGRLFTVPETLTERMIIVQDIQQKPLVLINLLTEMKSTVSGVLVFTKSVESAHRLAALLNAYGMSDTGVYAHAFSSTLAPAERQKLLVGLADGRVKCLICSDVMARGIDLGAVGGVVNYDVPTSVMGYIHRVGRTARAGESGVAVSLVTCDQMKWFKRQVVAGVSRGCAMEREKVKVFGEEDVGRYEAALKVVEGLVRHSGEDVKVDDIKMVGESEKVGERKMAVEESGSSSSDSSSDSSSGSSSESEDGDVDMDRKVKEKKGVETIVKKGVKATYGRVDKILMGMIYS